MTTPTTNRHPRTTHQVIPQGQAFPIDGSYWVEVPSTTDPAGPCGRPQVNAGERVLQTLRNGLENAPHLSREIAKICGPERGGPGRRPASDESAVAGTQQAADGLVKVRRTAQQASNTGVSLRRSTPPLFDGTCPGSARRDWGKADGLPFCPAELKLATGGIEGAKSLDISGRAARYCRCGRSARTASPSKLRTQMRTTIRRRRQANAGGAADCCKRLRPFWKQSSEAGRLDRSGNRRNRVGLELPQSIQG